MRKIVEFFITPEDHPSAMTPPRWPRDPDRPMPRIYLGRDVTLYLGRDEQAATYLRELASEIGGLLDDIETRLAGEA